MPSYRLYCLDAGGYISLADWIESDTDDEALAKASTIKQGASKFEVWQKNRLVAKLSDDGLE